MSEGGQPIEARLGARLIVRTAGRSELTDAGQERVSAAHILRARGGVVAQAPAPTPRGVVAPLPVSFGVRHVAPLLPEFLRHVWRYQVDLHLNDAMSDLLGEGYDAAIRIAVRPGASSLSRGYAKCHVTWWHRLTTSMCMADRSTRSIWRSTICIFIAIQWLATFRRFTKVESQPACCNVRSVSVSTTAMR